MLILCLLVLSILWLPLAPPNHEPNPNPAGCTTPLDVVRDAGPKHASVCLSAYLFRARDLFPRPHFSLSSASFSTQLSALPRMHVSTLTWLRHRGSRRTSFHHATQPQRASAACGPARQGAGRRLPLHDATAAGSGGAVPLQSPGVVDGCSSL